MIEMVTSVVKELSDAKKLSGPAHVGVRNERVVFRAAGGGVGFFVPEHEGRTGLWRKQANASFLPQTTSAESRRRMLFAILQDLVDDAARQRRDGTIATPLGDHDPLWGAFDAVHLIPSAGPDRSLIFPIHISVPAVYDSYPRSNTEKAQTEKGIRGAFLWFFEHGSRTGQFDDAVEKCLGELFTQTPPTTADGDFSVVDRALVEALTSRVRDDVKARTGRPFSGDWRSLLRAPKAMQFRPHPKLVGMGERLRAELLGLVSLADISRIEKVELVEQTLALHFAAYLASLPRLVGSELDEIRSGMGCVSSSPWTGGDVQFRYHQRETPCPKAWKAEYDEAFDGVNLGYPLLTLLNNVELASRGALTRAGSPIDIAHSTCWMEARDRLRGHTIQDPGFLDGLRVLAAVLRKYVGLDEGPVSSIVWEDPMAAMWEAIVSYFREPDARKLAHDKHQYVLEKLAGTGSGSFIATQPHRHFQIGDEYLLLRVLLLFERRDGTSARPGPASKSRQRLPVHELFRRLEQDNLVYADENAREGLLSSLARLGLLDRFSDVGEANFLRHPLEMR